MAQKYPELIVGAFIRNQKMEFLFVRQKQWKGMYSIPGGHVEFGESLVDALGRELKEELGIEAKATRLLDIQQAVAPKGYGKKGKHFIFFSFLCECKNPKITMDGIEIQGYKWLKVKDALKQKHNEFTMHTLKLLALDGTYEPKIPVAFEKKLLTQ